MRSSSRAVPIAPTSTPARSSAGSVRPTAARAVAAPTSPRREAWTVTVDQLRAIADREIPRIVEFQKTRIRVRARPRRRRRCRAWCEEVVGDHREHELVAGRRRDVPGEGSRVRQRARLGKQPTRTGIALEARGECAVRASHGQGGAERVAVRRLGHRVQQCGDGARGDEVAARQPRAVQALHAACWHAQGRQGVLQHRPRARGRSASSRRRERARNRTSPYRF